MEATRAIPRLLVVEDDPHVSTGLLLFLESEGFEVSIVGDGEAGLTRAVGNPGYDLIILDAMLPERDGFEVLSRMRAHGVATPVLMLTGLGVPDVEKRGSERGADAYLTKPFSTEELVARICAILLRTSSIHAACCHEQVG